MACGEGEVTVFPCFVFLASISSSQEDVLSLRNFHVLRGSIRRQKYKELCRVENWGMVAKILGIWRASQHSVGSPLASVAIGFPVHFPNQLCEISPPSRTAQHGQKLKKD